MIISRYLAREVCVTLAALTSILLLIFLSNQFVHYLARAADGTLPGMVVFKLLLLEIPNLLGFLLPLGIYMAILVAYGRLYAESEMIVLQASGYTQWQSIFHVLKLGIVTALITASLMFWANPIIARDRQKLIKGGGIVGLIQAVVPERIQPLDKGKRVFYVGKMSRDHTQAQDIFLAQKEEGTDKASWRMIWAERGHGASDANDETFVILETGKMYKGVPGEGSFQALAFDKLKIRLPHAADPVLPNNLTAIPTAILWNAYRHDIRGIAEIQWRLSVPIMALVLALLALPLSKVNPRKGKFAQILPAILFYILYANGLFVARDWMIAKWVPAWIGLFWVHSIFLIIAIVWLIRQRKP